MRNRIIRLKAAAVVLVLLASAAAQSEPRHEELPNFHQVNAQLYRGAQPRRGGIQRLTQFGVKTIINLRDDDERASAEEREARAAGLRYFNVSMAGHAKPTDEQVERVLSIINAPENQPVLCTVSAAQIAPERSSPLTESRMINGRAAGQKRRQTVTECAGRSSR